MQQQCLKRLAKEVFMLRYIPEHRVYEMSITWQSEKPSAPTIVYLSEIFIHPFIAPAQPAIAATPSPSTGIEIVKAEPVLEKKSPLKQKPPKDSLFPLKEETASLQIEKKFGVSTLNYDLLICRVRMMNIVIERNKEVVKHNIFKEAPKKKRKT